MYKPVLLLFKNNQTLPRSSIIHLFKNDPILSRQVIGILVAKGILLGVGKGQTVALMPAARAVLESIPQ
jgi:hypothetical protein